MILRPYKDEAAICEMVKRLEDMKVPTELLPTCPHCGKPMTMNLCCDDTFVEDEGWHRAAARYESFLRTRAGQKILFLELGVGYNTLLADDGEQPERHLRLYQSRTGGLPAGN